MLLCLVCRDLAEIYSFCLEYAFIVLKYLGIGALLIFNKLLTFVRVVSVSLLNHIVTTSP